MEKPKTTAKDFFLHLAMLLSLYVGVGFLLNLLFSVINHAYPAVTSYGYFYIPSISFPVSALLVLTPIFLLAAYYIGKAEMVDPSRKEISIKKWISYLTLFISGAIIAGDLVVVIYQFLDGQILTTAFLLKVLAVAVVLGAIFGYFFSNLKGNVTQHARTIWRFGAILLVVGSIVLGFLVMGSPRTQRLIRYDEQKLSDLQSIQSEVINYYQSKGALPQSIAQMKDPLSYGYIRTNDVQTGAPYEYTMTGAMSFTLCATFNQASNDSARTYPVGENWQHGAGHTCFERTIDPQLYPVFNKAVPQPAKVN